VTRETGMLLSGIKAINSDKTALYTCILALLTVLTSKWRGLWNYWVGNMDIKDWRLLKYDEVTLPEYLSVLQRSIKLSSSGSSSTSRRTQTVWS